MLPGQTAKVGEIDVAALTPSFYAGPPPIRPPPVPAGFYLVQRRQESDYSLLSYRTATPRSVTWLSLLSLNLAGPGSSGVYIQPRIDRGGRIRLAGCKSHSSRLNLSPSTVAITIHSRAFETRHRIASPTAGARNPRVRPGRRPRGPGPLGRPRSSQLVARPCKRDSPPPGPPAARIGAPRAARFVSGWALDRNFAVLTVQAQPRGVDGMCAHAFSLNHEPVPLF